ncbi:MAG TPA: putative Ig domain-containing protein, partial [Bacteroidales bacterium]|nr:putative Ig domain-containing protein [Bacteroidales bacterium]
MKKIPLLSLLACSLLTLSCIRHGEPESTPMAERWKFMTGDDPAWATPAFNDAAWGTVDPKIVWEDQGFRKYDGFAWYRSTISLHASMKTQAGTNDSIQFRLGKIDDCDQVFLNGKLIGENGRTVSAGQSPNEEFIREQGKWNMDRRYVLALNDPRILWDRENLIAVRCFDQGGIGGMFSKPFEVSVTGLRDRLKIDFSATAFGFAGDSLVTKEFTVVNVTGNEPIKGEVEITAVRCDNETCIFEERTPVDLAPGSKQAITVTIRKEMRVPAMLKVTFTQALTQKKVTASADIPRILTPAVAAAPRINGAKVFGVRPWSPFQFKIAATGEPPLNYRATDLPEGLTLNAATGIITGSMKKRGEYLVHLTVENAHGYAERDLKIVVGDLLSLTPPMGWNSWNCWGLSVSDKKVRQSADAMKNSGLIDHGWTYINIDDGWEDTHDRDGNILTNAKFPDMKALCAYVHSLGLKIGIYSSPGTKT